MPSNEHNELIINHLHPLKERVIGMEKTIEYHDREINEIHESLKDLKDDVGEGIELARAGNDLSKKIWNSMLGGGVAIAIIWAIVKFAIPLFTVVV